MSPAAATAPLWREFGRQLRNPTGLRGRLVGRLMALANRTPNRMAIEALQIKPFDTVLELGFGPGRALRRLGALAPRGTVLGIDQSADMLAQASWHNRRAIRRGQTALRLGPFAKLPFKNGSIDKILAVNVAYFFCQSADDLREARRVLRPGGRMVIYVSDKATMSRWPFVDGETHATYGIDELVALVRYGGFETDELTIEPVPLPFGYIGLIAVLQKRP